jgi:NhaP-type Na+/H+ or K+/H+ antiporter
VRSVFALATTWEFLGFVANSLIFLLIGIALDPRQLATFGGPIAVEFLATLLGRAVAVYGLYRCCVASARFPAVPAGLSLGWATGCGLAGLSAQHPAHAPHWNGIRQL